jgi:DNA-binding transcriptional MerR regulator
MAVVTAGLRSGQVAAAAGVNLQTLRYYERRGLLAEPPRTLGGHRIYPPDTATVLQVIKTAQRLGFTLDEVADLLAAASHRHGRRSEPGLRARAQAKLADIEQKIVELTVIRDTLRNAVGAGCDDLVVCAQSTGCPLPFAAVATDARLARDAGIGPARVSAPGVGRSRRAGVAMRRRGREVRADR